MRTTCQRNYKIGGRSLITTMNQNAGHTLADLDPYKADKEIIRAAIEVESARRNRKDIIAILEDWINSAP